MHPADARAILAYIGPRCVRETCACCGRDAMVLAPSYWQCAYCGEKNGGLWQRLEDAARARAIQSGSLCNTRT